MNDPRWGLARSPEFLYELLDRRENRLGRLRGVRGGQAEIVTQSPLGGSASLQMTRQARQEINLYSNRVAISYDPGIEGLDPWPIGVYLFTSPKETNDITRREEIGLLTKMAIPSEDTITDVYSVDEGTLIIPEVSALLASTGETRMAVTASEATFSKPLAWKPGVSKLTIINEMLQAAGYRSLWCDGTGQYRIEPYVEPGNLAVAWVFDEVKPLHKPGWSREQNLTGIPNRVVVVSQGTDEEPAIVGLYENNDPDDPLSIPNRGVRSRTYEVQDLDSPEVANAMAQRYWFEAQSPVARLEVTHAIVPLDPGNRVRFSAAGETRDATVQRMTIQFGVFNSQCKAEWREVSR